MPENIEGVGGTLVEREPGRGRAIDRGTGEIYIIDVRIFFTIL